MTNFKTVTFDASAQRVVPLNPTDEMLTAGWDALGWSESGENDGRHPRDVFHAMLAAAPTPAAQSAGQEPVACWLCGAESANGCIVDRYCPLADAAPATVNANNGEGSSEVSNAQHAAPVNASEPIGVAEPMPGSDGLTMVCFEAAKVPVGTSVYAAPVNGGERAPEPRTYTTQPGESVAGIALRQCGDENAWKRILECNPQFDFLLPPDYFPVGTVITLPPVERAADAQQVGGGERVNRKTVIEWLDSLDIEVTDKQLDGLFHACAADAQQVGGETERIKAIPTVVWWHPDGYIVHNNLNGDDLIRRSDVFAALSSPAKVGGDEREAYIASLPADWHKDSSLETWFPLTAEELAATKRMFGEACADLGRVNEALGLDPEDAGADPILDAIEELKARAALSADGGEDKRDAERLDWMCQHSAYMAFSRDGEVCWVVMQDDEERRGVTCDVYDTTREAIDAAIAANQSGKGGE